MATHNREELCGSRRLLFGVVIRELLQRSSSSRLQRANGVDATLVSGGQDGPSYPRRTQRPGWGPWSRTTCATSLVSNGCRVCRDPSCQLREARAGALSRWYTTGATTRRAGGLFFRSPAAPRLRGWAWPTGTWSRATGGSSPPKSRWAEPCGPPAEATGCSRRTGTSRTASGPPCSRSPR